MSDEGPIASEPQVEGPGGHFREYVPSPSQDGRFVLRLEFPFHVVEQSPGRHREQRFVALVFERLSRPALLGAGLLQLAVLSRVIQPGPDLRVLLNQVRMPFGLGRRNLEVRLQSCAFALVGERNEVGLLREVDADKLFFAVHLVQRVSCFLPSRKFLDPAGERRAIAELDSSPGEQALHGVVDLRDSLLQ